MIPKEKYSRANGMMSLIDTGPSVFSPMLAGAFLTDYRFTWHSDFRCSDLFYRHPGFIGSSYSSTSANREGQAGKGSLIKEAAFGFKYIFARRGLLSLLSSF
jgi:hypothetical protein